MFILPVDDMPCLSAANDVTLYGHYLQHYDLIEYVL